MFKGLVVILGLLRLLFEGNPDAIRVSVPLSKANELDLADLVGRLSSATRLTVEPPPSGITLPVTGIAGTLSRKMLEATLGDDVRIAFQPSAVVFSLDRSLETPERRQEWAGRLRDLAAQAEREARRRRNYGMHALRSYRPNDPARPTVCLVHGMNSSSGGFIYTIPPIEAAGYGVVVYDYPFNRSLEESCARFARDLAAFRRVWGEKRPWALVGHSMGSLLVRNFVEGPDYGSEAASVVLIAPVNQGSSLAQTQSILQLIKGVQAVNGRRSSDALAQLGDGVGAAANDMLPGSVFLKRLNARGRRSGVPYHILAGDVGILTGTARKRIDAQVAAARTRSGLLGGLARFAAGDDLADRLDELTDGRGDGCVSVARTKLAGVSDHVVLHANHAELIRAPLLFSEPGPVACMPDLLRALKADLPIKPAKP